MIEVVVLTKDMEIKWDNYISNNKNALIYHTLEYRNAISQTYGYAPLYFLAIDSDSNVKGAVVSFYTKTLIGGKKIQTLPFGAYCDILYDTEEALVFLIRKLIDVGKQENINFIELKLKTELPPLPSDITLIKKSNYCILELELSKNIDETRIKYNKRLRKNLRNYHQKAIKDGLIIRHMKSYDDLKEFYDVYIREMRDKHKMIPKPYSLIETLFNLFYKKKNIDLILIEHNNKIIAGIILYFFKDRVIYEFSASDLKYNRYSPAVLMLDYAIQKSHLENFRIFDFSITSLNHISLLDFKLRWGSKIIKLPYYYYLINSKHVPDFDYNTSYPLLRMPYRYIPLPIIKLLAPLVIKQLA